MEPAHGMGSPLHLLRRSSALEAWVFPLAKAAKVCMAAITYMRYVQGQKVLAWKRILIPSKRQLPYRSPPPCEASQANQRRGQIYRLPASCFPSVGCASPRLVKGRSCLT